MSSTLDLTTATNWGDLADEAPSTTAWEEEPTPTPVAQTPATRTPAPSSYHKGGRGGKSYGGKGHGGKPPRDVAAAVAAAAATVAAAAAKAKPTPKPAGRGFALLAEDDEEEAPAAAEAPAPVPVGGGAGAGAGAGAAAVAAADDDSAGWETTKAPAAKAHEPKPAPVVKMPEASADEEQENLAGCRTTLIVRNLPMDITERKLEAAIFDLCGDPYDYRYEGVKIPRKMGKPRGFAFVNFFTRDGADECFERICDCLTISGKRVTGQSDAILVEYARSDVAPTPPAKKTA